MLRTIEESLGIKSKKISAPLEAFIGTSVAYLASANGRLRAQMIRIVLVELGHRQFIAGGEDFDEALIERATDAIARACVSATKEQREEYIVAHARAIPAAGARAIARICARLPQVGMVLEFAPHERFFCAREILRESRAHYDSLRATSDLPAIVEKAYHAEKSHTIIINALNLRALTYLFLEFVRARIVRDGATFAMIVHGNDVIINMPAAVASMHLSGDCALTVISVCEKKIIAVSDVVALD